MSHVNSTMYDRPYEMQYELYSDMGKDFYWGSYTIAQTIDHMIYLEYIYECPYDIQSRTFLKAPPSSGVTTPLS